MLPSSNFVPGFQVQVISQKLPLFLMKLSIFGRICSFLKRASLVLDIRRCLMAVAPAISIFRNRFFRVFHGTHRTPDVISMCIALVCP